MGGSCARQQRQRPFRRHAARVYHIQHPCYQHVSTRKSSSRCYATACSPVYLRKHSALRTSTLLGDLRVSEAKTGPKSGARLGEYVRAHHAVCSCSVCFHRKRACVDGRTVLSPQQQQPFTFRSE